MKRTSNFNELVNEIQEHSINVEANHLFLFDKITEDNEELNIDVASQFIKNIRLLEKTSDNIVIHLCTKGGDVYSSFAIYDAIKYSRSHITIITYGCCMSMGTIILQAADVRVSLPNVTFMLHEGDETIEDNHKAAQSWLHSNKTMKQNMLNIYANKCKDGAFFVEKKYTLNKIRAYIQSKFDRKQDWILNPEEALTYGIIDQILTEPIYNFCASRT